MANDPGLANDSCIFLEAVSGDGGVHDANEIWWLSPDIKLVGPASRVDNADAGQTNPITVTFHRKPASSNCIFPGDESVTVEVWVANPSLVMSPTASSSRVGFIGSPVPGEGTTATQQIDWDVPPTSHAGDPQNPGPKSLVARVYPSSGVSGTTSFFLPGDQHVAQRNLCVVSAPAKPFKFDVTTVGFGHPQLPVESIPNAKLKAVLDLHPNKFVSKTVAGRLKSIPGFQGLITDPLSGGFGFDLTNLNAIGVTDHSHPPFFPPLHLDNPSFEASVVLQSTHVNTIRFLANLEGLPAHHACIFHLMQISLTNIVLGGLTLVIVRE
jgi:hypothetical protein